MHEEIDVDYLVVGAGAGGMAFTEALLAHSDATVAIVDRGSARSPLRAFGSIVSRRLAA